MADVLVDVGGPAAPGAAAVAPDSAARVGGAQPGGVRRERAVEGDAGLGQVARRRQPEVERPQPRRRQVEHLQEPSRRSDRQQVETHPIECGVEQWLIEDGDVAAAGVVPWCDSRPVGAAEVAVAAFPSWDRGSRASCWFRVKTQRDFREIWIKAGV